MCFHSMQKMTQKEIISTTIKKTVLSLKDKSRTIYTNWHDNLMLFSTFSCIDLRSSKRIYFKRLT